ncbi:hypothetical protein MUA04_08930 [Enterobacteriaceae bacterium H11S18]|uniref:hypothetical protein n=1 Tax=Dryocola clanedunensis TaxID=2925396 RepID=UPI0022F06CE0|nr:hypothetical protein [Dryocola clanedunensis]MCT4710311.1 hypothetical protein [Dryocola clanedunensis]
MSNQAIQFIDSLAERVDHADCYGGKTWIDCHEGAVIVEALRELQEYRKAAGEPVAWTDKIELEDMIIHGHAKLFKSRRAMGKPDPASVVKLYAAPPLPPLQAVPTKEHELRELVNELRDIAVKYRDTQQLREHIAKALRAAAPQQ